MIHMAPVLYSNGCPKCRVLKAKLENKNINFIENNDLEEMKTVLEVEGIFSLQVLHVDETFMKFEVANTWVNSYADEITA